MDVKEYADDLEATFKTLLDVRQVDVDVYMCVCSIDST